MEAFLGALEGETWRDSVWIFRDLRELAMDHGGQGGAEMPGAPTYQVLCDSVLALESL